MCEHSHNDPFRAKWLVHLGDKQVLVGAQLSVAGTGVCLSVSCGRG